MIQFIDLPLQCLGFDCLNFIDIFQEKILSLRQNVQKVFDHRAYLALDGGTLDGEVLHGACRLLEGLVEMVEERLGFHQELLGQLTRIVDRILQGREGVLLGMMQLTFVTVGP